MHTYVCIYICVYVYICLCVSVYVQLEHIYICTCMYTNIHEDKNICSYIVIWLYYRYIPYIPIKRYRFKGIYLNMKVYGSMEICIYIHIYI